MFGYNSDMKSTILFLFIIFSAACAVNTVESQKRTENAPLDTKNQQAKQLVLLELFTSEGCSSCPPADRNLAFLEKEQPVSQAEIVTLSLHVDYWDYIGWKDAFSSPLFTQRQELYAEKLRLDSSYTPQMIVDGRTQFVGSNSGDATKAITEAARVQKGKVEIIQNGDKIKVKISELPAHEAANIMFAVTEDNLSSNVSRGENSGRKLEHQSVVRELKSIGTINSTEKTTELETSLTANPNWKSANLKFVVFVQENESRKVLGVGRIADK